MNIEARSNMLMGNEFAGKNYAPVVSALRDFAAATNSDMFIFGSLGRRIAMSNAANWGEFEKAVVSQKDLAPRRQKDGVFELDVAVIEGSYSWSQLEGISGAINANHGGCIRLEPHLINITSTDAKYFTPVCEQVLKRDPIPVQFIPFEIGLGVKIWTFNRLSHLLYNLSYIYFRQKDVRDMYKLVKNMWVNGDFQEKGAIEKVRSVLDKNPVFQSPLIAIKMPYWFITPDVLKRELAIIRGKRKRCETEVFPGPLYI